MASKVFEIKEETPYKELTLYPAQGEDRTLIVFNAVLKTVQENTDGSSQVVHRVSGKQRRASLEEYKAMFLPVPSIEDRKPVFLSRDTRDTLDRIVSLFGSRRMSVSGLMENIARHHLATYREDIEAWRKL